MNVKIFNYIIIFVKFYLLFVSLFINVKLYIIYLDWKEIKKLNEKLKEINNWINICNQKQLIRENHKSSKKPKITALITIYNSQDYLHTALRSVQNQLLNDIEILLVDDGSVDHSLKIMKRFRKEDKRIKIIKNKKNRGALYSKSIGILKSNGHYTMILDSDDLFANDKIFNICYYEAIKNNIDMVEFSGYNLESEFFPLNIVPLVPYYLRFKKNNELVKQPELSFFIYKKLEEHKYQLIDGYLCGKCIKSDIIKMSIKVVGPNIYEQKINYGDDRIINFILFKLAESFKYINEYGIIYRYNNNSITHSSTFINNCKDELVNIWSIYNYTKNTKESEIIAFEIVFRWDTIIFPGLNYNNYKSLKKLINKLLLNKYICDEYKLKLLSYSQNLTESKSLELF